MMCIVGMMCVVGTQAMVGVEVRDQFCGFSFHLLPVRGWEGGRESNSGHQACSAHAFTHGATSRAYISLQVLQLLCSGRDGCGSPARRVGTTGATPHPHSHPANCWFWFPKL